jgi:Uncharacterised nucleotidyltransferase
LPPSPPFNRNLIQNEWRLLLECASPAADPEEISALLPSADWARLLALAEDHGVMGHLAASLNKLGTSAVPASVKRTLADRQREQIFHTLKLSAELFRILDQFASEKIAALVVKGPVLAMQAYGDPAMRSYGDLDLLVRQGDIRRATELMIAAGYRAAVSVAAIDSGKIPGQYLFSKPEGKLLVELHNDLTLRYFPRRLPLEKFFDRQIRVRLDAHDAPALCVEDELVLICIHGAKHFWERLIWIADVAALVTRQANIDWRRVAASAKEAGAERMLHTGLRLAKSPLNTSLPAEAMATVEPDQQSAQLANQILNWLPSAGYAPPGLFERGLFRLRMRGGFFAAPAYLLRLLLSPTEEDWRPGSNENRHGFLAAVRRPFRLARKYARPGKS